MQRVLHFAAHIDVCGRLMNGLWQRRGFMILCVAYVSQCAELVFREF